VSRATMRNFCPICLLVALSLMLGQPRARAFGLTGHLLAEESCCSCIPVAQGGLGRSEILTIDGPSS
jgi:hypothetical protein